jgi:retinol dehydrogenase 12
MTSTHKPVAIVTGANTGIGLVTATKLAQAGYDVRVGCRSADKLRATQDHIARETGLTVRGLTLDLAELDSVRAAADAFVREGAPLALLVNNAGVASLRGVTRSGFENTFAINHLGTFLLTNLLLPSLRAADSARVVTVASQAHRLVPGIPWDKLQRPTGLLAMPEYGVSKLANILMSAELARRLAGTRVTTYSLHPGAVATDVWRNAPLPVRLFAKQFLLTPEQGAATTLYCATSPEVAADTGLYYENSRRVTPSKAARDPALAKELWERSLVWTGLSAA